MNSRTLHLGLIPAMLAFAALSMPAVAAANTPCSNTELIPTPDNGAVLRDATLCLINAERVIRRLKAFTSSPHLQLAAQIHSEEMVKKSFFGHVGPSGNTLLNRVRHATPYLHGVRNFALAENIAWGSGAYATPRATVKGWMASAGHRANILNRRYRQVGVGVAIGAPQDSQGQPAATYTTDFGHRALR